MPLSILTSINAIITHKNQIVRYYGTPYFTGSTNGTVITVGTSSSTDSIYDYLYIYGVGQISGTNILSYICNNTTSTASFSISTSVAADRYVFTITPYKLFRNNTIPASNSIPNSNDYIGNSKTANKTINYINSSVSANSGSNNQVYQFLVSVSNAITFNFPDSVQLEYALVGGGGAGGKYYNPIGITPTSVSGAGAGGEVVQGKYTISGTYFINATIGIGGNSGGGNESSSSILTISNGASISASGGGMGDQIRSNVGAARTGINAGGCFWNTTQAFVTAGNGFGWAGVNFGGGTGIGGGGGGGCGSNSSPQQYNSATLYTTANGVKFLSNSTYGYNILNYYPTYYWGGGGGRSGTGTNAINGGLGGGGGGGASGTGKTKGLGGGSAINSGQDGMQSNTQIFAVGGNGGANSGGGGGGAAFYYPGSNTHVSGNGGNGGTGIVIIYIPNI